MKIKDLVLIVLLVILGILTRTVFHIGPNIEFVTAATAAAGYFMTNKKLAFAVPLITLFVSDIIIGNTIIYIFTWSSFIVAILLGIGLSKAEINIKNQFFKVGLIGEGIGIFSTIIFFLWTNFGVVVTTSMYHKTFEGLMHSYTNGLPFLINQLLSNLLIVPALFVFIQIMSKLFLHKGSNLKIKI